MFFYFFWTVLTSKTSMVPQKTLFLCLGCSEILLAEVRWRSVRDMAFALVLVQILLSLLINATLAYWSHATSLWCFSRCSYILTMVYMSHALWPQDPTIALWRHRDPTIRSPSYFTWSWNKHYQWAKIQWQWGKQKSLTSDFLLTLWKYLSS